MIYGFNITIGKRGLFIDTPLLLLSIFAMFKIFKKEIKVDVWFKYYLYIAVSFLCFSLMLIFNTNNYGGGSGYDSVRWFGITILTFSIPLATLNNEIINSKITRKIFIILASFSILISLINTTHLNLKDFVPEDSIWLYFPLTKLPFMILHSPILEKIKLLIVGTIIYSLLYKFSQKLTLTHQNNNYTKT